MDRDMLEQHLTQVEQHIGLGEQHIARQREIVEELRRNGHDVSQAEELLALFEQTQTMHIADRDRLCRQLAVLD